MTAVRLAALVVLIVGALAAAAWAAAGDTQLVSRATGASGPPADADVRLGDISADGRYVVFDSLATNLGGGGPLRDVFVRDTVTATTTLISRGLGGEPADGNSTAARISADGRYVAFQSTARNLHAEDSDPEEDIYVHDMQTGTLTLASRASGITGPKGNDRSFTPGISADGRHVAFSSFATNLPDDADGVLDIFLRDLDTNTTTLVSRADGLGGEKANGTSTFASVSGDGRMVAFASAATNLPDDPDSLNDVFVRDLEAGTTTLASRQTGADGAKGSGGPSSVPQLTPSGRYVAFGTAASNLGGSEIAPAILVRDLQAATTTLASRASSGATPGGGQFASGISDDGRLVAFSSRGTNVHPDDADDLFDVFVRDLSTGTTTLVSRASGAGGANANGNATVPAVSGDGAFVAFESSATNLHPDDDDTVVHVFTRELGEAQPPPPPPPPPPPAVTPPPPPIADPVRRLVPQAGRSQVVQVVSGVIRVRQRGARRFVRIRADTLIRDGSEIDATRGVLRLVVAAVRDGSRTSSALVSRGRAIVDQNRARRPLTTLRLSGPLTTGRRASAAQRRKKRRRGSRSLFTETDGGRFRTRGTYGAATASGTAWLTTDRAGTTTIRVTEGRVRVRDLVRRRTITLRAPRSYVARRSARRR